LVFLSWFFVVSERRNKIGRACHFSFVGVSQGQWFSTWTDYDIFNALHQLGGLLTSVGPTLAKLFELTSAWQAGPAWSGIGPTDLLLTPGVDFTNILSSLFCTHRMRSFMWSTNWANFEQRLSNFSTQIWLKFSWWNWTANCLSNTVRRRLFLAQVSISSTFFARVFGTNVFSADFL